MIDLAQFGIGVDVQRPHEVQHVELVRPSCAFTLLLSQPDVFLGMSTSAAMVETACWSAPKYAGTTAGAAGSTSMGIADKLHFDGKVQKPHLAFGGEYRQFSDNAKR